MFRTTKILIALLLLPVAASMAQAQNCAIISNFNGTPISAGDYVWFNSVVSVRGLGSQPVNVFFNGGTITFTVNGVQQNIYAPPATMTFSPDTTQATTSYDANGWTTNLQSSGLSGNDFLTAVAVQVPTGGWPGGINSVQWTGTFTSDTDGITVQWQFAAAVYSQLGSDYNSLSVKPVDDNRGSQYQNSDHAGTPENYKYYVLGGARGGGGSNYTGSYSATASCPAGTNSGPPQ